MPLAQPVTSMVRPSEACSTGHVVKLKGLADLESSRPMLDPAALPELAVGPGAGPDIKVNRAIEFVQRTALAMHSIEERLRRTERYAMEFIHNAQADLAAANEKLVRSEAKVQELESRISELEKALARERQDHQHARDWLTYLQEEVVERLGSAATFLDDLNSNAGPLLGMLEAKAIRQRSSTETGTLPQHEPTRGYSV